MAENETAYEPSMTVVRRKSNLEVIIQSRDEFSVRIIQWVQTVFNGNKVLPITFVFCKQTK